MFLTFRRKVVPILRTYPTVRIRHAGCSTGEEVYSMAILLKEENLYDRARIYATDISRDVLRRAKIGIFPLAAMQECRRLRTLTPWVMNQANFAHGGRSLEGQNCPADAGSSKMSLEERVSRIFFVQAAIRAFSHLSLERREMRFELRAFLAAVLKTPPRSMKPIFFSRTMLMWRVRLLRRDFLLSLSTEVK